MLVKGGPGDVLTIGSRCIINWNSYRCASYGLPAYLTHVPWARDPAEQHIVGYTATETVTKTETKTITTTVTETDGIT